MNFGEMIDWIGRTTKRPDKAEDIQDAINDAIEYATTQGSFSADLVEGSEAVDSAVYSQSLVISTTFPRYRKMKYLRPSAYTRYLSWRDPSRIFDENGRECLDVWYRAGDNIVFKLSNLQELMRYGFYQYPLRMTEDSEEHWMLEQMAGNIHKLACADIFEQIGNAEEGTRYRAIGINFLTAHIHDKMDGVSHS